ncbi:MAG: MAPEG family protein [Rugosibacter sp.]|nr:MAG: MAPEG family protein [Rugosibacter sp.]
MVIAVLCVALLGFLVIGLGFVVSMTRGSTKTMYGYTVDPADRLYKAIRAHGNTTEYVPMLAVLILTLGMLNPAPWMMWCMGLVTLSRFIFVFGIVLPPTMAQPSKLRFIGSLGTYLFGIVLCLALLMKVYPALMALQQAS